MPAITDTYDICLGTNPNSLGSPVLLTVTYEPDAEAIVSAINASIQNGRGFQTDGLVAFYQHVERAGPNPTEG